jgi:hypothetical protein
VEVVALQAARQDLHQTRLTHLFLNSRVVTDVVEDVETDEEELVLLPDEHVEFFELRFGRDAVVFVVAAPHLDILAVEQVEALDLVLEHFDDGCAHFVFGEQILELLVIGQDVEDA